MTVSLALDGRVVIVGGAGGGGIGTAIAVMLARAGAKVVAVDRSESALQTVADRLAEVGGDHRLIQADLFNADDVDTIVERATRELGPVRGLVNVVGGHESLEQLGSLLSRDAADTFDDVLRFNLKPTLLSSISAARAMAKHGLGGSIVHIASVTGLVSMPFSAGYAASKAALINLARTMAVEWGALGIRVNAVASGTIVTAEASRYAADQGSAAQGIVPVGRCGAAEEIAGPVLFLLSDMASYVDGTTLVVDGGSIARAPYNDLDDVPVFINDPALRERLLSG